MFFQGYDFGLQVPEIPLKKKNSTQESTDISSENQWLEDEMSIWNGPFFGGGHSFTFAGGINGG